MEDRDSYRMLLGMLDSLAHGTHFTSPLLYNRQVSFGYYSLIYALTAIFGHSAATIIAVMNAVSLVSAVLFVIPFYLVVERLFDRNTAIAACVILPLVPDWWNSALYGHPNMPGMLLFFSGLALLARSAKVGLAVRLGSVLLIAAALSFRFDLILLFPAIAAVILSRDSRLAVGARRTIFYVIGAIVIFKLIQFTLPPLHGGPRPESMFVLLHRYQSPSRFFGSRAGFVRPFAAVGGAFGPLLLLLIVPACWILLRRKNFPQTLFTVAVIAIQIVFWLPNPTPVRHYIPMGPAVAVTASMSGVWFLSWVAASRLRAIHAWASGIIIAVVCTAVSVGLHWAPGRAGKLDSPFWFRFSLDDYQRRASRIALDLIALRGPNQPLLVLCDSNFVAGRMQTLVHGVSVKLHQYRLADGVPYVFHQVDYGGRTFMMLEESFYGFIVDDALDRKRLYPNDPVLVDPYNPLVHYNGPRLRAYLERTPEGERIQTAVSSR